MPLLDHFHPPLSATRHWEGHHSRWSSAIADALNEVLPDGYFAEPQVHSGPRVEVDVATFDGVSRGGVATATQTMPKLAPADRVLSAEFPEQFSVQVFESSAGPRLVAAVELVSPANKDRPQTRRLFAAKCAAYLQQGCGLIIVDVVTNRLGCPLDDLLALIAPDELPAGAELAAASFRPLRTGHDSIELRLRPLAIGEPLPELPLALDAATWVMLDLEAAYTDACSRSRI